MSETHGADPITAGNAGPVDAGSSDPHVPLHRAARDRPLPQASASDIRFPAGQSP